MFLDTGLLERNMLLSVLYIYIYIYSSHKHPIIVLLIFILKICLTEMKTRLFSFVTYISAG